MKERMEGLALIVIAIEARQVLELLSRSEHAKRHGREVNKQLKQENATLRRMLREVGAHV